MGEHMEKRILLFESRALCYESTRDFVGCLEDAFEKKGFSVEICDLSLGIETKLEEILQRQEEYLAAFDFNSLLTRAELEDGTPYLNAFRVPFYNYLVDHPLYHHAALKRPFANYSVICIDTCHKDYVKQYYPHIEQVCYLPLGAMQAGMEKSWKQKRFELLFLGTYEPEEELYDQLDEYPMDHKKEVMTLIEMMESDAELTQEAALERYARERGEVLDRMEFARRLNQDYLADKYLRNLRRRQEVLAAAECGLPFTVMGHGWEELDGLERQNVTIRQGVGFAASIQMIADAKMLLNTTPGFHGGLHDRVYSSMINGTVCLTERSRFAESVLQDGRDAVLYDSQKPEDLQEKLVKLYENPNWMMEIAEQGKKQAFQKHTWEARVEALNLC